MDNKKLTIGILFALAIGGVGYLIYNYSKQNATPQGVSNPAHLNVPTGASTIGNLKAANPSATDVQIAALAAQLQKLQQQMQKSKGGGGAGIGGGGGGLGGGGGSQSPKADENGFVNGVRKNADGSVDKLNPDGTYTETDKDGTVTNYTNSGIAFEAGDKIVKDAQGNQVVQHDNGNGTYTEIEKDGSTTVYTNDGKALGEGDVYDQTIGSIIHDNGNGTYTETDSNGNKTTLTTDGAEIPDGFQYDPKTGLATNMQTGDQFDPTTQTVVKSGDNIVYDDAGNVVSGGDSSNTTPTAPTDTSGSGNTPPVDNPPVDNSADDFYNDTSL